MSPITIVTPPDCVGLGFTGADLSYCLAVVTSLTPGCQAGTYLYPDATSPSGLTCLPYANPVQAVSGEPGPGALPDSGNTEWQMASAALVMFQTPCVGFFYSGLAGETNVSNTILQSFTALCVVSFLWWAWGYALMFGPGSPYAGNMEWAGLNNVGQYISGAYGVDMPNIVFAEFQCMFAAITPAIIPGGPVGRMKFSSFVVFVALWTTFVYDFYGRWMWSYTLTSSYGFADLGFMGVLGSLDFAGGTVIHVTSGTAALVCALFLGPRKQKSKVRPHNVFLTVFGATVLWFGWYGFNAGSATAANGSAAIAGWNTHLATAMAALSWMLCEFITEGHATPVGWAAGAVAGLVAITPACGFIMTWAAWLLGVTVSPICYYSARAMKRAGIDDSLDAFAIHAVGGAWGAIYTGLFAAPAVNPYTGAFYGNGIQLGYQLACVCLSMSYTFVCTLAILILLKYTIGVRVSEEDELAGLDVSEHGMKPNFAVDLNGAGFTELSKA